MMCVCKYFEHSRRRAILHDFQQASYHEKQRAKRLTRSKPSYLFSYQPPRFHGCLALMLVEEYRKPSSNASLHNFDIVDR